MIREHFISGWTGYWMRYAGLSRFGRFATRCAALFAGSYKSRCSLAQLNPSGYISPSASIEHSGLILGRHVFLGDRTVIYRSRDGGTVNLEDDVQLYADTIIETGEGGSVRIGAETHVQPRCQFSGYKASIAIGRRVEIAPNCVFYPYDHTIDPGRPIREQPLKTKGGIIVGDDVWLGVGVTVLDGVRIGNGAVIGAGAVVTGDIPDGAVAAGVPARVIKMRGDIS